MEMFRITNIYPTRKLIFDNTRHNGVKTNGFMNFRLKKRYYFIHLN